MTKDEIYDWISHPVTKQVKEIYTEVKNTLAKELIDGVTLGDEIATAKKVGMIKGLEFFLNLEFEGEDDVD